MFACDDYHGLYRLIGVIGGAGLMAAPVVGVLCDKYNRILVISFALLLNCIGYSATYFVENPMEDACPSHPPYPGSTWSGRISLE